jgi:hypothetical protein
MPWPGLRETCEQNQSKEPEKELAEDQEEEDKWRAGTNAQRETSRKDKPDRLVMLGILDESVD